MLLAGYYVNLAGSALNPPRSRVVLAVLKAPRVVLKGPTIVELIDGREEYLIKPCFKVSIKEPATLLLFPVEPGEEEIEGYILKANKPSK